MENEEELASLEAALLFLEEDGQLTVDTDALASGLTSSGGVSQAQVLAPATTSDGKPKRTRIRKKTRDYNPNRARDERRDELVYLQARVNEMQSELQQLQASGGSSSSHRSMYAHALPLPVDSLRSSPLDLLKDAWSETSVWKQLAARQGAERHRAELENIRLRTMLQAQIKVAYSLERLLYKRSSLEALLPQGGASLTKRWYSSSRAEDDAVVFAQLTAYVESAVLQIDRIFESNGLNATEQPCEDAAIRDAGEHGMFLEVFVNKLVPFDMLTTANAVYDHFTHVMKRMPMRSYTHKKTKIADDTVTESFGIELHAKRTTAAFRVLQVMRRYMQTDRVVIVVTCSVDPVQFSSQPTSGIRLLETGYIVIKQPTTMSSAYSLIQTCFHMAPTDYDPTNKAMVGQITDFFLDSIARNIQLSYQMIENRLVEESSKRQDVESGT